MGMLPYGGANSGAMNSYFNEQYTTQKDLHLRMPDRRGDANDDRAPTSADRGRGQQKGLNHDLSPTQPVMGLQDMSLGASLDDIIMQNSHELMRRQSIPQNTPDSGLGHDMSPPAMMKFGSDLQDYQFDSPNGQEAFTAPRRQSIGTVDMMPGYQGMTTNPVHNVSQNFYPEVMMAESLETNSGNYAPISAGIMDLDHRSMDGMNGMNGGTSIQPNLYPSYQRMPTENIAPVPTSLPMTTMSQDDIMQDVHARRMAIANQTAEQLSTINTDQPTSLKATYTQNNEELSPYAGRELTSSNEAPMVSAPPESESSMQVVGPKKSEDFGNIYSSSGFDMLGILTRVVTRKNPEINIGAVDLSCAFVVCDVKQDDCPIVYVSDVFGRLTGYNKHEVLGRNCRFLQAPDGQVVPGVKRRYVDDESVLYIKSRLSNFRECQRSLLNYRKGGQPFLNLLTMIPVCWDNPDEIRFFVGFQVDLVELPASVTGSGSGGTYDINYCRTTMPVYTLPDVPVPQEDTGLTVSRNDVSAILHAFNRDTTSDIRKREWNNVLLENSDDVIHVLSLKGRFLYLSPSCRHVLEYNASELAGTSLSSICHPSDIVNVTRELKDTPAGQSLNIVYRIRRKKSGYTWFESHGSLCVDQGKGRKVIVLVGRERPVYALSRTDIDSSGGIGEAELWTKLSTSGMFLFVSANVKSLLDRQPADLIGTSIQAIMGTDSRNELGRLLEKARTGKKVVLKHEIINKSGRALQATTTVYPGDASEGHKPTFLVAQTRLIKPFRATQSPTARTNPHHIPGSTSPKSVRSDQSETRSIVPTGPGSIALPVGTQDLALASRDNIFDELKTTRSASWQFELRQMEKTNRLLAEELASLLASKKKRKRRRGAGLLQRDCANCHTTSTPEWRRGPSGQRDLCNSCGLRWAKQNGGVSPRHTTSRNSDGSHSKTNESPNTSPAHISTPAYVSNTTPNPNLTPNSSSTPKLS